MSALIHFLIKNIYSKINCILFLSFFQRLKEFNTKTKDNEDDEANPKCNLRVNLFSIAHETQMPFELLFKKNLRKRQTDLFLDSWRKVTTKLGLSYQFKCTSKQQFFNLFMDAFQNCIEEIGNESVGVGGGGDVSAVVPTSSSSSSVTLSNNNNEMNSTLTEGDEPMDTTTAASAAALVSSSSSVQHFRAKMASSFEQCKLWPVSDDEYTELLEEARKKTAAANQLVASSSNTSNTQAAESPLATNQPKKGSSSSTPPVNRSAVVMSVAAAVSKSGATKTSSLKREQTLEDVNDDASASFKSADELAIIKSLADLINHDREMQKIVKDMIRDELGKLIRFELI